MALQTNTNLRPLNGLIPFSAVFFFGLSFQFVIFLISVCTQFHQLFFRLFVVDFPEDYF